MKIKNVIKNKEKWLNSRYEVFSYDRQEMIEKTRKDPEWIHFGCGNLFRAFEAAYCDKLLDEGALEKGVIAVSGKDSDIINTYYWALDNMYIAVTLKSDGSISKRVVGSIAESIKIDNVDRIKEIFANENLKVATFTLSKKDYLPSDDNFYFRYIASYLYHRYRNGAYPLTLSSHDDFPDNGKILKEAVVYWVSKYDEPDFEKYIEENVSFPLSMIDKIVLPPERMIGEILKKDGVEDIRGLDPDFYLNCFCNSEEIEYLYTENDFRNGRPNWTNVNFF